MNTYVKNAICVAVVIFSFLAGWYVNGNRWQKKADAMLKQIAEEEAMRLKAVEEAKESNLKSMNRQASEYQSEIDAMQSDMNKLRKELSDARKKNPLPVDCRLDADRLSVINKAVISSNNSTARAR